MNRRKAIAGLAVVCALCFSAFAASGASAAGTTAGECTSTASVKDFEDAHCDRAVSSGGTFGHTLFKENEVVHVTATNDLTGTTEPAVLEGVLAGVVAKVTCGTVSATGTVTNKGPATAMTAEFGTSTTKFTNCTVNQPTKCEGQTAIVGTTTANVTDPTTLGLGEEKTQTEKSLRVYQEGKGTEMGLKFTPLTGQNLTTLMLPSSCGLGTTPFPIKGFFYALPGRGGSATLSGATAKITVVSSLGGLTLGGNPVSLTASLTFRKEGGNPLILTTTSS
jgi:hypothetical protein